MKAILYADWMNFRLSIKSMLLAPVIFLVWAVIAEQPIFFFSMLVVMGYMFPSTAFSAEQSAGWDRLSLSLPILRHEVVASRFFAGAGRQSDAVCVQSGICHVLLSGAWAAAGVDGKLCVRAGL